MSSVEYVKQQVQHSVQQPTTAESVACCRPEGDNPNTHNGNIPVFWVVMRPRIGANNRQVTVNAR